MSSTAVGILIGYSILVIVSVAAALIIFRSTRVGFHVRTADRDTVARREGYWGLIVVAFLVILLGGTIFQIPYSDDNSDAKTPQSVQVVGRQYAWTVDPPRIRAGVKTRFEVRAEDVNHAIGLYNPDDTLIKQVNVLPGVTQNFIITPKKTGTYEIRCLEFCGVDHHLMKNDLEVTR